MTLAAAVCVTLIPLFTPEQGAPVLERPALTHLGADSWSCGLGAQERWGSNVMFTSVASNLGRPGASVTSFSPLHFKQLKWIWGFDLVWFLATTAIMCCCASAFGIVLGWTYFSRVKPNNITLAFTFVTGTYWGLQSLWLPHYWTFYQSVFKIKPTTEATSVRNTQILWGFEKRSCEKSACCPGVKNRKRNCSRDQCCFCGMKSSCKDR